VSEGGLEPPMLSLVATQGLPGLSSP
jgi:hypothetical protein